MFRFACLIVFGMVAGGSPFVAPAIGAEKGRDDEEDVKNAAKKLGDSSYAWTSTPKSEGGQQGGGGGRRPQAGPTEGKTEKDGYTTLSSKSGDTTNEAVLKGGKAVVKSGDAWKSTDEFGQGGGGGQGGQRDPASFFARGLRNFKLPAEQAGSLVDKVGDLKKGEDGSYAGDLTEEGAKELLSGGGGGGGRAPTVTEPKGSVTWWVKDGVLVKYEIKLTGKMTFGGQGGQQGREIAINRTTTVEIKDVGAAKVEPAEEAKKKLE